MIVISLSNERCWQATFVGGPDVNSFHVTMPVYLRLRVTLKIRHECVGICLSDGPADHLESIRPRELYAAYCKGVFNGASVASLLAKSQTLN